MKKKHPNKIFDLPQTNPFRDLCNFKVVTNSRFQDNSTFSIINNQEEK